jgi:hypothetical protein
MKHTQVWKYYLFRYRVKEFTVIEAQLNMAPTRAETKTDFTITQKEKSLQKIENFAKFHFAKIVTKMFVFANIFWSIGQLFLRVIQKMFFNTS